MRKSLLVGVVCCFLQVQCANSVTSAEGPRALTEDEERKRLELSFHSPRTLHFPLKTPSMRGGERGTDPPPSTLLLDEASWESTGRGDSIKPGVAAPREVLSTPEGAWSCAQEKRAVVFLMVEASRSSSVFRSRHADLRRTSAAIGPAYAGWNLCCAQKSCPERGGCQAAPVCSNKAEPLSNIDPHNVACEFERESAITLAEIVDEDGGVLTSDDNGRSPSMFGEGGGSDDPPKAALMGDDRKHAPAIIGSAFYTWNMCCIRNGCHAGSAHCKFAPVCAQASARPSGGTSSSSGAIVRAPPVSGNGTILHDDPSYEPPPAAGYDVTDLAAPKATTELGDTSEFGGKMQGKVGGSNKKNEAIRVGANLMLGDGSKSTMVFEDALGPLPSSTRNAAATPKKMGGLKKGLAAIKKKVDEEDDGDDGDVGPAATTLAKRQQGRASPPKVNGKAATGTAE